MKRNLFLNLRCHNPHPAPSNGTSVISCMFPRIPTVLTKEYPCHFSNIAGCTQGDTYGSIYYKVKLLCILSWNSTLYVHPPRCYVCRLELASPYHPVFIRMQSGVSCVQVSDVGFTRTCPCGLATMSFTVTGTTSVVDNVVRPQHPAVR